MTCAAVPFRDQLIAASLKPTACTGPVYVMRSFPRSIDRSLIGAICPLTTLDTGLSFRDQIDRGLTKRHCESSLVVFCNTLDSGS